MYIGTLVDFLGVGGPEMMLILVVVLLLFGGKKLPEFARGLGKGIRDFKDASEGVKREIHRNINSVGITDDINDMVSDFNGNERHHPSETDFEKQMYPQKEEYAGGTEDSKEDGTGSVVQEHGDEIAQNNSEDTKIETNKAKI